MHEDSKLFFNKLLSKFNSVIAILVEYMYNIV